MYCIVDPWWKIIINYDLNLKESKNNRHRDFSRYIVSLNLEIEKKGKTKLASLTSICNAHWLLVDEKKTGFCWEMEKAILATNVSWNYLLFIWNLNLFSLLSAVLCAWECIRWKRKKNKNKTYCFYIYMQICIPEFPVYNNKA